MRNKNYDYLTDISDFSTDGRLTEPSDGVKYEWIKMIELSSELGRPLTISESSKFIIA